MSSSKRPSSSVSEQESKRSKPSPVFFDSDDLLGTNGYRHENVSAAIESLAKLDWSPILVKHDKNDVIMFIRFLALKSFVNDTEAKKISPGERIDAVWHAAILRTAFYQSIVDALGHPLHHNPDNEDDEDRETRIRLTVSLGFFFFGVNVMHDEIDEEPIVIDDEVEVEEREEEESKSESGGTFTVTIVNLDGSQIDISGVSPTTTVAWIKQQIETLPGQGPAAAMKLIYAGTRCVDDYTAESLGLVEGSVMHRVIDLRGC